jgi:hypothetical protein
VLVLIYRPVVRWRRRTNDELRTELAEHARSGRDFELLVEDGWRDVVLSCHRAVVAEFPQYELLAVKEKYGALALQAFPRRWRPPSADGTFSAWTDEEHTRLDSIVDPFEQQSVVTCERCGQRGSLREQRRHMLTLCDACDAYVKD